MSSKLFPILNSTVEKLTSAFNQIPDERMELLSQLTGFVQSKVLAGQRANLNFICTHNSRRSHISQIWAQTAAYYYNTPDVECFSGGTEATAFNPRAVVAMKDAGFNIEKKKEGDNPLYEVKFDQTVKPITVFSKKYDDLFNLSKDFAAVMTCSHADENCPLIPGASKRITLTYDDPKEFDGTPLETEKYRERVLEIGKEILYAFSQVKK